MANAWDGISTAFLVGRQVSRRCFDEDGDTRPPPGRIDALVAPLSVRVDVFNLTEVSCEVRAYRFADGSVLEVYCVFNEVTSMHAYSADEMVRRMTEASDTLVRYI